MPGLGLAKAGSRWGRGSRGGRVVPGRVALGPGRVTVRARAGHRWGPGQGDGPGRNGRAVLGPVRAQGRGSCRAQFAPGPGRIMHACITAFYVFLYCPVVFSEIAFFFPVIKAILLAFGVLDI